MMRRPEKREKRVGNKESKMFCNLLKQNGKMVIMFSSDTFAKSTSTQRLFVLVGIYFSEPRYLRCFPDLPKKGMFALTLSQRAHEIFFIKQGKKGLCQAMDMLRSKVACWLK